jgi:hypothetical protein
MFAVVYRKSTLALSLLIFTRPPFQFSSLLILVYSQMLLLQLVFPERFMLLENPDVSTGRSVQS